MLSHSRIEILLAHFRANPTVPTPVDPMTRLMESIAQVRAEAAVAAASPNREVAMLTNRGGYLYEEPKTAKRHGRS